MIFMEENPVRSLIENLGRELSQKSPSSQIFPYGKLQGKEITPANFVEITKTENPRRIAFVDGGDGVLEESPNFMIIVNRVYFCMFEGKKRISASKLKHRIEFFSYVVSEVKDNDDKKIVSYNTKLFPYSESDLSYLPAEEDLESKTENTGVLQESHLVSLSRRFAGIHTCDGRLTADWVQTRVKIRIEIIRRRTKKRGHSMRSYQNEPTVNDLR
jgi:hypothetical protein